MNQELDLDELIHVMSAVSDYKKLFYNFRNLSVKDPNSNKWTTPPELKEFWDKNVGVDTGHGCRQFDEWAQPNMYVFQQTWGNTSGGWCGFGGSAMTTAYTVVIENLKHKVLTVYYGGKLAYILEIDDVSNEYKAEGYRKLPGYGTVTERTKLKLLFETTR